MKDAKRQKVMNDIKDSTIDMITYRRANTQIRLVMQREQKIITICFALGFVIAADILLVQILSSTYFK